MVNSERSGRGVMKARAFEVLVGGLAIICLSIPRSAGAQSRIPLSYEVQPGFAVPRGALNERWSLGLGLSVNATAEFRPNTLLYVGYSLTAFDVDITSTVKAVDAGPSVGVRRSFPVAGSMVAPWLKFGLLVHTMDVTGDAATGRDHGIGFELGGGVEAGEAPAGIRPNLGVVYRQYTLESCVRSGRRFPASSSSPGSGSPSDPHARFKGSESLNASSVPSPPVGRDPVAMSA